LNTTKYLDGTQVSSREDKKLPCGTWLHFNNLPQGTSDVEFQSFLASVGLEVPLENINLRDHAESSSALIAVPNIVVLQLVNWAINGATFQGRPVAGRFLPRKTDSRPAS